MMKRDFFPSARTVAANPSTRSCTQRGSSSAPLHGVAARLGLADFEHFARLTGPQPLCPEARAKTPGIGLARQAATDSDGAGATFPLSAGPKKNSLQKLQAAASRAAMCIPMRSEALGSIRPLTLSDGRQHLKRSRPRSKMQTAPRFSALCPNEMRAHVAGGRREICHLPFSHKLQGISSVSSTVFGLSWPVRWRGIKCLPPPFT
jgi:hypothetical protein